MTNLSAAIEARMNAIRNAPKSHASVITFSDGTERRADHPTIEAAELSLRSYRPLIGRHEYISRSTGKKITIVSCEVIAIA